MPITVTCPTCNQPLSAEDQYAGMNVKCPKCSTVIPLPAASAAPIPSAAAFSALPPPELPPLPSGVPPPAPAFAPAAPSGPGLPFSLAGLGPVASLTVPIGLFFLVLAALSTFLPWQYVPFLGQSFTGIASRNAILLLLLCLIVGGIVGSTFCFKDQLQLNAVIGGAFGTFAFFVTIAELSRAARAGGAGAGLWIGFVSAIGIVAAFVVLAVPRPFEWPYLRTLNMPPVMQRYGALIASQAGAVVFGFLYLLIALAS
jgi:phage FluMu protein Com